jgi:hypothetical protein
MCPVICIFLVVSATMREGDQLLVSTLGKRFLLGWRILTVGLLC